jgi:GT2 family glycosyltransferase
VITAVVPTYKRPDDVERCLASLQEQTLEQFDILVVDNSPGADLRATVENAAKTARVPMTYLHEPALGLHNARHAAVRHVKTDLMVFTDDDATFHPDWLKNHQRAFDEHPDMVAAGGPVRPIFDVEPPQWLTDYMALSPRMFAILSLMEPWDEFQLGTDIYFFGVNMAVRTEAIWQVDGFNPDSFGAVWLGDGESGFNRKLWAADLKVGYVPDAIVYHHIPADRMTLDYFKKREANDGASDMYGIYHEDVPSAGRLFGHALYFTLSSLRDWAGAAVLNGKLDPRSIRVQTRAARSKSRVSYILRLMRSEELRRMVEKTDWLGERPQPAKRAKKRK